MPHFWSGNCKCIFIVDGYGSIAENPICVGKVN
jgi:hypothetical protein